MPKPPNRMDDLMVDLETKGSRPGAQLLSIGAQFFDPLTGKTGEEFYIVVNNIKNNQGALGLHEDPATMDWWARQDEAARDVLRLAKDRKKSHEVTVALERFSKFILKHSPKRVVRVWGNGADFDNAILAVAYMACHMEMPWEFWNSRCFRTLKNLHKAVKTPQFADAEVAHNALSDAKHQVEHALAIFRSMRGEAPYPGSQA